MDTDYNAELTFTPKLNEASLKLAERAAVKWKERSHEYRKSRERALVAEANAAFTFHPAMNSKSQKIITRIRKFEDIKNVESLQYSFENREDSFTTGSSSEDGMNMSSREVSFETASVHVTQEAETFIQEVLSNTKDDPSEDDVAAESSGSSEKECREVQPLVKPPARKILNLPYNNADYLFKIKSAKETALNAMRLKRTFTILGPYPYLRKSLNKRGWVEKFSSHSAQPILGAPQPIRPRPARKKKKSKAANKEESSSSSSSEDSSDDTDSDPKNDPDFNRIVSRLLKDISPTFIWTIKRDDIDFKYLDKDQIVNHYCKASSFTTKIGLSYHLRSLPWYDTSDPNEFFPRCYQLYDEDDREDFKEDFEICASLSILKIYIRQHQEFVNKPDSEQSSPEPERDGIPTLKADHVVPINAVDLAVEYLKQVMRHLDDEFLDIKFDPKCGLTKFKVKMILNYSSSLSSKNFRFSEFKESVLDTAQTMLEEFLELRLTQESIEGCTNTWIMKPGAKSRGRGVIPQNNLDDIIKLADSSKEEKWVVQKYIEHPLLVHNTKFDIRQWFMVTDWNPLTLYFYQDSYLRFGSRPFTLDDFDPSIHLCNNSIQKKFLTGKGMNETSFAKGNMWTSAAFKKHLSKHGNLKKWDEIIYPGMKKAIQRVMMTIQDIIEDRKNSFELYGADFMVDSNYTPWLIEINCSPAMGGTTKVTERLCSEVLDDCIKVIIDKRDNKSASTGKWEIIYKQPIISVPPYIGVQLALEGKYLPKPAPTRRKCHSEADLDREPAKKLPRHPKPQEYVPRRQTKKQELKSSKIVGITIADEIQCKKNCASLICKHTEKFKKELYNSLSLNPPAASTTVEYDTTSSAPVISRAPTHPAKPNAVEPSPPPALPASNALPSIISSENNASPQLSSLSISPISSVQVESKWKKPHTGRVSDLINPSVNPYRLQQIISRQARPKHLDMLSLQNRYSHNGNLKSVKIVDIKPKRRKVKKVSRVKTLSKLTACPHCDTNQKGIILNLLKSGDCGSTGSNAPKKDPTPNNQRPKKHFRVSLSQVSTMSHKIVDIQQSGSSLKVVGEQTST